jgi:hypothetical protein
VVVTLSCENGSELRLVDNFNPSIAHHITAGQSIFLGWTESVVADTLPIGGVHLRSVAGARRAIPRTIHGVRLAITSTARSERRIAVRRSGVDIDASSASADPARAPWRSTAKSCQVPGTPRSSTLPRSSKAVRR